MFLVRSGAIDGVIDWDPMTRDADINNLAAAIFTGLEEIGAAAKREVLENPEVANDYVAKVRTERPHKQAFEKLQKDACFRFDQEIDNFCTHPTRPTEFRPYIEEYTT